MIGLFRIKIPREIAVVRLGPTIVVFVAIALLLTLQVWWLAQADFFELQVARVMRIFYAGSGASEQVSTSNYARDVVTIGIFQVKVFILYAIPLLVSGFYVTFAGLEAIHSTKWKQPEISIKWTYAICGYFGFVGLAFGFGAESHITRLFDVTILIVAPIAGFVSYKIYSSGKPGVLIVIILIILSPTVSLVGIQHGLPITFVPPTETEAPAYPAYQTESEIKSIEHSIQYYDSIATDGYSRVTGRSIEIAQAKKTNPLYTYVGQTQLTQDTLDEFSRETSGEYFLFRTKYHEYSNVTIPPSYDIVYDSGGGKIFRTPILDT